jgi:hypothetical protein
LQWPRRRKTARRASKARNTTPPTIAEMEGEDEREGVVVWRLLFVVLVVRCARLRVGL